MKRTARDNRPNLKPVEKVELSNKNIILRIILVAILIFTAMVSFGYGINQLFSANNGWQEIKASGSENGNCADEFIFQYNLGKNGEDATAQKKRLIKIYSDLSEEAYQIFCHDVAFNRMSNLYTINQHPNEEIQIDAALYDALQLLQEYDNRMIYLAPIYEGYDDIFYCANDMEANELDPVKNQAIKEWNNEVLSYINDPKHISLELKENQTVKLCVSDEYLAFAKEEEIPYLLDFIWMKNAFRIDYIAKGLVSQGYCDGIISSFDGFSCSLNNENQYSYNLYGKYKKQLYQVGVFQYEEKLNLVQFRNYPVNSKEQYRYYEKEDGVIKTPYLSLEDGLDQTSKNELLAYSNEKNCAEILLTMIPLYISEKVENQNLLQQNSKEIYSIWLEEKEIMCTQDTAKITDLYDYESISFEQKSVQ